MTDDTVPPGPRTTPHGSWTSPIDAASLAAGSPFYEQVVVAGDDVLWTRSDPATGAVRLHRHRDGVVEMLAPGLNIRSRVHEYGGGAVAAGAGVVVVSSYDDQRLYRVDDDGTAHAVTADTGGRVRFGDGVVTEDGGLVAVRETHGDDGVANELVLVDLHDGSQAVLVDDHDFVAAPRLAPDGRLAWLAWDHPDMPWDGAAAHVGRLVGDRLVERHRVVGGDSVAVADLAWRPDGALVTSSDESGFWEVSAHHDGSVTGLTDGGIDHGKPRWNLGRNMLAVVGPALVVVATDQAMDSVRVIGPDGAVETLPAPAAVLQSVVALGDDAFVALEADTDGRLAVRRHGLDGSVTTLDDVAPITDRPGDLAEPVPLTVPVGDDGAVTHAFFHPPANAEHVGPEDEAPPLVVFIHGGPTSHVAPVRTAAIAWWTTRGIAVADVNYRGSTGFGRSYRRALWENWGETDVADVVAVADELADRGWVDRDRMAIRGGSAGGFTTLAVLTSPDHPFACGCSFFGVADLGALAAETHKFESRYLDRMIGPLPQAEELMRQRSPLTHVDRLAVPLLVLQGLEDRVVPPRQAEMIVEAAARRGVPHAHLTFAGEGHGFRRPDSIVRWHESELAFYGEVMGFRPAGDLAPVLDAQSSTATGAADPTSNGSRWATSRSTSP